jgi:hypothetical protein
MNYRVILMGSGLLLMFSVYGFIMTIGAMVDDSDAVTGNFLMGAIFGVFTLTALQIGMRLRKKAHKIFAEVIARELDEQGFVEAVRFSEGVGVSLDDAREILNHRMSENNWSCTELKGYNAEYRPR